MRPGRPAPACVLAGRRAHRHRNPARSAGFYKKSPSPGGASPQEMGERCTKTLAKIRRSPVTSLKSPGVNGLGTQRFHGLPRTHAGAQMSAGNGHLLPLPLALPLTYKRPRSALEKDASEAPRGSPSSRPLPSQSPNLSLLQTWTFCVLAFQGTGTVHR